MRKHLPWLDDLCRFLVETCGRQPGRIKFILKYEETGDGVDMVLPAIPKEARLSPSLPDGIRLREIHTQICQHLTDLPQSAKQITRLSGYQSASYVRTALAELVRWGLAVHTADGYTISRAEERPIERPANEE